LEIPFWLIAIVLGFFHTWADHHYLVNADAMSYLDIAEAYLRRDWSNAINAYWSPLYSWIIAAALLIFRPSPYWKFTVLHLVNFGIYLFALVCFRCLIFEMVRAQRQLRAELAETRLTTLPDWALIALGYSLFIWATLFLITLQLESPDMLVAASTFLAGALVLRVRRHPSHLLPYVLLGIVLGFGYLAKTVMLPIALACFAVSIFATGNIRRAVPRVALAMVCFVLVAGPFVFAISRAKGRLTLGENGKLNYLWAINRVTAPHWQGEEPGSGVPKHPTRLIFHNPKTYEFAYPVGGTYPVWYDPTYWYEGSVSRFDLWQHFSVLLESSRGYYELFSKWGIQYGLLVGLLSLYLVRRKRWWLLPGLTLPWNLIVPALVGIALFALINVQGRYVGPFVVLIWLSLFSAVRVPDSAHSHRFMRSITIVLVAVIIFTTLASSSREAIFAMRYLAAGEKISKHEQWEVSEALREIGMIPGDQVAVIGNSFRAFWAHLLGVRIVAEVRHPNVERFWELDKPHRAAVIDALASTSAKVIVAEKPASGVDLSDWQKIGNTEYYIYLLKN
jgi:hypothetical protein